MAWKATTAGLCRSSFRAACVLMLTGSAAGLLAASAGGLALSTHTFSEPQAATGQYSNELMECAQLAAYLLGREATVQPDGAF